MLSVNILPFLKSDALLVKSRELFTLLNQLRSDKENSFKGTREPGHDLPDHLIGDPTKAYDHPIRPREGGTNFWDEHSRRWIMAALSTTMGQTYEQMHFLVAKFLQLSSTRARRLVEAYPVLRSFMWTEYLRACTTEVQLAEFRELLTFDHDSFYKAGSSYDRDPSRPLSPEQPERGSPPPSNLSSSTSSSDTDSSTEDEALPVSQSRFPAASRIYKRPKQRAGPLGKSVPRDPLADPVSVPRELPGDSRGVAHTGVEPVPRDPPAGSGCLTEQNRPTDPDSWATDPALSLSTTCGPVCRGPIYYSQPVQVPHPRPTAPTSQSKAPLELSTSLRSALEDALQGRATGTGSSSSGLPATDRLAAQKATTTAATVSFEAYSRTLDRVEEAAAEARKRESELVAEIDRLRKVLYLNTDSEAFRATPSSSSSSSGSGFRPSSSSSSSSSSGTGYPLRQGMAAVPTPSPTHTHTSLSRRKDSVYLCARPRRRGFAKHSPYPYTHAPSQPIRRFLSPRPHGNPLRHGRRNSYPPSRQS